MTFQDFFPNDVKGWCYLACMIVLIIALYLFNKAILKCKESIEQYVIEIRDVKQANTTLMNIVDFVADNSTLIDDYATTLNKSQVELLTELRDKANATSV